MRLDQYLVKIGIARSRTQAQEWIQSGLIQGKSNSNWQTLTKASQVVNTDLEIRVLESENLYVSRAGLKLDGALKYLNLDVSGFSVMDIGMSTGGFTDCLLQKGAEYVLGVEVGKDQISERLKFDSRIQLYEGVNARYLTLDELSPAPRVNSFDLIVMDVSFISVTHIIPRLPQLIKASGYLLSLIKPQFELGPESLDKRGVVKDNALVGQLEGVIRTKIKENGLEVLDYFPSTLKGKDGNQEFFVFARR